MKAETNIDYTQDLANKPPSEVADLIVSWRDDDGDGEPFGHACDLLNAIEPYLRGLRVQKEAA